MAYHQAQTLTTMQSNNGLAWGVVAYVDARRGQMPEAISAINLAGQFAPENKFVAHTAGELVAWYDNKADKTTFPDNAKDGLAKIRGLLGKQTAFTEAYDTAHKAYQAQTKPEPPPAQIAPSQVAPGRAPPPQVAPGQYAPAPQIPDASQVPAAPLAPSAPQAVLQSDQIAPLGYAAPATAPAYYPDYDDSYYGWAPDYCYDWGPGWIAPRHGAGGSPVGSGVVAAFSRLGRCACLVLLTISTISTMTEISAMATDSGAESIWARMVPWVMQAIRQPGTRIRMARTAFLGRLPGRALRWRSGPIRVPRALRL